MASPIAAADELVRAPDPQYDDRLIDDDDAPYRYRFPADLAAAIEAAAARDADVEMIDLTRPDTKALEVDYERVVRQPDTNAIDIQCTVCHSVVEKAHGWVGCKHVICGTQCRSGLRPQSVEAGCPQCRRRNGASQPQPLVDYLVRTHVAVKCVAAPLCDAVYELGDPHEPDNIADYWRNERSHRATCPHILVVCPKGCGKADLRRSQLEHHMEQQCPCRTRPCVECNEEIPVGGWAEHNTPPAGLPCRGFEWCTNGCTTGNGSKKRKLTEDGAAAEAPQRRMVRVRDLEHHLMNECPRRFVECALCGIRYPECKRERHLSDPDCVRLTHERHQAQYREVQQLLTSLRETNANNQRLVLGPPAAYRRVWKALVLLTPNEVHGRTQNIHRTMDDALASRYGFVIKRGFQGQLEIRFERSEYVNHMAWLAVRFGIVRRARADDAPDDVDEGFNIAHPSSTDTFSMFTMYQASLTQPVGYLRTADFERDNPDLLVNDHFGVYFQVWRK